MLGGLSCLLAYWGLCAAVALASSTSDGRPESEVLYNAASAFKDHDPDLWRFASELHAHMPGLLSPLEQRVVRLVHRGAPLILPDAA